MPGHHRVEMGQAGQDAGLDRSVPRLASMRVGPDDRVREQPELPQLVAEEAASPRSQPSLAITTIALRANPRRPHRLRKAAITSPSRVPPDQSGTSRPAAASASSGCRRRERRGDPGEPGADREDLDLAGQRPHDPVGQPEQGVGVGLHRAGDVDQQHDPPGAYAGPAAAQGRQLPGCPELGAEGAAQVDRATMLRPAPKRTAQRRLHIEAVEEQRQPGPVRLAEPRHVAMTQHLGGAGPHGDQLVGAGVPGLRLGTERA